MACYEIYDMKSERLLPKTPPIVERAELLSLLDATTANFALSNAIWLFEKPEKPVDGESDKGYAHHFRQALVEALDAYPHFSGHLKVISAFDGTVPAEAEHFPAHGRRFGRVYVHFGTAHDPGVEFISAKSSATLDQLCMPDRPSKHPAWDRLQVRLEQFVAPVTIHNALRPYQTDKDGRLEPIVAIQLTELSCGGLVLNVKMAHPLGDATALIQFVKHWAAISRGKLRGRSSPMFKPLFDPWRVDAKAAGDIDAEAPDPELVRETESLPFHRYDWWNPSPGCPFPDPTPDAYRSQDIEPAGKPMPWSEWDIDTPVAQRIIHFTDDQVQRLWQQATNAGEVGDVDSKPPIRISRHDAILAHVWASIARARSQHNDAEPVYCDISCGLRPALQLHETFLGTPLVLVNASMSGASLCKPDSLPEVAKRLREAISSISSGACISAHLHRLAYELSPQRIWQAFLGSRHILLTTWARAGLYEVDFGLGGGGIRFAEGLVPPMDGNVLIKEGPPKAKREASIAGGAGTVAAASSSWTTNGVDVAVTLDVNSMARLVKDPMLFGESL